MKIHLISDLHLEGRFHHEYAPAPTVTGDVCVLAGDICTLRKVRVLRTYLKKLKDQFDEVIYVLGNHEFYNMNYYAALDTANDVCNSENVRLLDVALDTDNFEYKGVKFWGSTLWTDFGFGKYKSDVEHALNDYRLIEGLNANLVEKIHENTVQRIDWDANMVVTHHMPILREHSKFPLGPITYGFCCTGLEEKIAASNIKYWLYGHTHDNAWYDVNGTQVVSNQTGYEREYVTKGYDSNFILEV